MPSVRPRAHTAPDARTSVLCPAHATPAHRVALLRRAGLVLLVHAAHVLHGDLPIRRQAPSVWQHAARQMPISALPPVRQHIGRVSV
eukprot:2692641-Prymnesium_polylepis.1